MFGVASSAFPPWRCKGLTCLGRNSGDREIGIDEMFDMIQSLAVSLVSSFSLIGLAEIGDKSQLVCMALAARYRAAPVLAGSILAFALLNFIAVTFGAALAGWVSPRLLVLLVAALFIGFGIHALRSAPDDEDGEVELPQPRGHSLFLATFLMIVLAEFGDKTQIAVVGLATTMDSAAVWLGATLALATTSALGVWAGRTVLQRVPVAALHRISGALFLLLGILALSSLW